MNGLVILSEDWFLRPAREPTAVEGSLVQHLMPYSSWIKLAYVPGLISAAFSSR
jgi:hypothetical protein